MYSISSLYSNHLWVYFTCSVWVYISSIYVYIYRECNCLPKSLYTSHEELTSAWMACQRYMYIWHWNTRVTALLLIFSLSAGNLVPRHVKRVTLRFVPLDLVCDVVKVFEHVEDLRCVDIRGPQQVRLPNTCLLTAQVCFSSFWYAKKRVW